MFKLIVTCEIGRPILTWDYIRFLLASWEGKNAPEKQFSVVPRQNTRLSSTSSFSELVFEVVFLDNEPTYAEADDIRQVKMCHVVLFSGFILTTKSGKGLENIGHAHVVLLMYNLLNNSFL